MKNGLNVSTVEEIISAKAKTEEKIFILASASERRKTMLRSVAIVPDLIFSPEIDETPKKNETPDHLAERLSREKAAAAAEIFYQKPENKNKLTVILSADTVVAKGKRILPKAETEADFKQCVKLLSGGKHSVRTGIAVRSASGVIVSKIVKTVVTVKRLTDREIDVFYRSGEWRAKAGGYALQGVFGAYVKHLNGSYGAVVGLPAAETVGLLEACGVYAKITAETGL